MTASVLAGQHHPHAGPGEMMYHCWVLKSRPVTLPAHSQNPTAERAAEHDRALGADPVEHPPPDLRGDHEADEEVEDVDAGVRGRLPSAIWAYSLAKKNTGTNTQHRDPEHHVLDQERRGF